MPEFVIFSLVAPMGAFGDLAGWVRRGSDHWPGRSALLGLAGAALGVRRDDREGQAALACWQTAVSVLTETTVLRDFHTVQTVPSARIKRPATRRDAVAALNRHDNGLITWRDYRSDCAFGVVLWGGDGQALAEALERPAFVPYLGRKSCPLSAPMAPAVVAAEDPLAALAQVRLPAFLNALDLAKPLLVASDVPLGPGRTETRWDDPLDRGAWHFGQRTVHIHHPEGSA